MTSAIMKEGVFEEVTLIIKSPCVIFEIKRVEQSSLSSINIFVFFVCSDQVGNEGGDGAFHGKGDEQRHCDAVGIRVFIIHIA